jgi:hypothetical protein
MAGGLTRREPEGGYEGWEEDPNGRDSEGVANIEKGKEISLRISKCSPDMRDLYLSI